MNRAEIEREVRRLAPWYHDLDLGGVRTSSTSPCDHSGHRRIWFPEIRPGYWRGKTVLDVACADGAWSFGALKYGVARVDAFDCRPENVEKANFAKRVLGADNVTFHVASCDSWLERHPDRRYDKVLLCGILYHLTEPWRTIEQYCGVARESILMASALFGGEEDGYQSYAELDNIAASDGSVDSLMAKTARTLLAEFARHGFRPAHIRETGGGGFGGGCAALLESCRGYPGYALEREVWPGDDFEIHLTPLPVEDPGGRTRPFDLQVVLYNRTMQPRAVAATLRLQTAAGKVVREDGPHAIELPGRRAVGDDSWSESFDHRIGLDLREAGEGAVARVELCDPATGEVVASNSARVG